MTSLKIKYFIKSFLRTSRHSKYKLQLYMNKEPTVSIKGSEIYFDFEVTSDKTKDGLRVYKECLYNEKFDTFWIYSEDLLDSWMKVVKTVIEIFKFIGHSVIFDVDQFPTRNKSIIDFIKSQTPSIDSCEFHGNPETDEDVEYFFQNIIVTEFVGILLELSDHFKFPQINFLDICTLNPANWLSFNQLLHFKGSHLCIHGSPLTNHELNQFLILWMTSQCHQNLSFLRINITDPESIDTILDLPHEIMDPNLERIVIL